MDAAGRAVLVVDDEPATLELLGAVLQEHGVTALTASDGAEALRALATHLPAGHLCAIVLDVRLPGVDGLTILENLRGAGYTVPVIMLSASPKDLPAAQSRGATAVLAKPFDLHHLLHVVAGYCPH